MTPTNPITVLITSAGTASAINVIKALRRQSELPLRLLACDMDPSAAGLRLADEHHISPPASHPDYWPSILNLCDSLHVDALFPIHSSEIEFVAERAAELASHGVKTLLPEAKIIRLCNDKKLAVKAAMEAGIPVPASVSNAASTSFPLFTKPQTGSGSKNARRIDGPAELNFALRKDPDLIVQEYVEGVEVTVDALCDASGDLIVASPRERTEVKAGQSVKGITLDAPPLVEMTRRIVRAFGLIGPCNLQFILRDKEPVFIELNPRFAAGGLMLTVEAGANIPLIALKLIVGVNICQSETQAEKGIRMTRYSEEIFY
jgi:carbamoyl-phosphate synthase large subunit